MKKNVLYNLHNFHMHMEITLRQVFKLGQLSLMTNFEKSSWYSLIARSRFAKISSYGASALDGIPHREPCTIAIYRNREEMGIILADTCDVSFKRLDTISCEALDRVRRNLDMCIMAPSFNATEKDEVQREYIMGWFERHGDEENFYIA